MTCSIDECNRPVLARGLCKNHYQRARNREIRRRFVHPPCLHCGGVIAPEKNKNATYCSIVCKQKAIDERKSREALENRTRRARFCKWCKAELGPEKRSNVKFCSVQCGDYWHNNIAKLMTLQAKKAARRTCEVCNGPIPDSRFNGAVYCSQRCMRLAGRSMTPTITARQQGANLMRLYGITIEQRDAMFVGQGSVCAICVATETNGKGWHVDHDHVTGKIRGILCHRCNLMLGNSKDDSTRLRAAADYLDKHI